MKPEKSFVRQQSKERKDTLFIGSQDCSDYSGDFPSIMHHPCWWQGQHNLMGSLGNATNGVSSEGS